MPTDSAAALIPPDATLPVLREIAAGCRACDLWERGTQTVFGEGRARAEVLCYEPSWHHGNAMVTWPVSPR